MVEVKGGLSVSKNKKIEVLPLPVGGIMSDQPAEKVAKEYEKLSQLVRSWDCTMSAPFMTLSFMALLVIPELKLGDSGLFDVRIFRNTELFLD